MKKVIRWMSAALAAVIVSIALEFLIDGVPMFGAPDEENIEYVIVEHGDYPDEIKKLTDERDIELSVALLGYLRYSPLKDLSDDNQLIRITYFMKDGTELEVSANRYTVWWKGKPGALSDENTFVKMCTAVFFLQT